MVAKYSRNAAQSGTKGMWPDSGNALTAVRREDWNDVSSPW
jgi:hypothetical protein